MAVHPSFSNLGPVGREVAVKRRRVLVVMLALVSLVPLVLLVRWWKHRVPRAQSQPVAQAPFVAEIVADNQEVAAEGDPSRFGLVFQEGDEPPFSARDKTKVDYNRQIKPILSTVCFSCHGPAKQRGKLRLDLRAAAVRSAIVPGKAAASPLIARISSPD